MDKLFSPWRLRYITTPDRRKARGCVFCRVLKERRDRRNLILLRGRSNFVILNKYPYNNGHLMIVPSAHIGSLQDAPVPVLEEMIGLVVRCEAALRTAYRPTGINLGMNLGRSAGAGIEGHVHMHLVPRWDGDTNFMTVVHGTRVIPEALDSTYRRLRPLLSSLASVVGAARRRPRGHRQGSSR
ncbi:MAG TPA: HIT domain-containing protein [Candidatus Polarisedimenticolia bacterium]|nr:HIT domain-containing protein [Candidatus Polarisedimenticolia bacterium]